MVQKNQTKWDVSHALPCLASAFDVYASGCFYFLHASLWRERGAGTDVRDSGALLRIILRKERLGGWKGTRAFARGVFRHLDILKGGYNIQTEKLAGWSFVSKSKLVFDLLLVHTDLARNMLLIEVES